MTTTATAPGYQEVDIRGVRAVALSSAAGAVRAILETETLHSWAGRQPGARAMAGRATAWAAVLPNGLPVVVRHSRHGGALAWASRDLFLRPTRAPAELDAALRLERAGVTTPQVIAYAIYPAFGPFVRADVMTRQLDGLDFPAAWRLTQTAVERATLVRHVGDLLATMREAGALHPDLNLKNILIGRGGAALLDVDRTVFLRPGNREVAVGNLGRILRSADKWNRVHALGVDLRGTLGESVSGVNVRRPL